MILFRAVRGWVVDTVSGAWRGRVGVGTKGILPGSRPARVLLSGVEDLESPPGSGEGLSIGFKPQV